MSTELLRMDHAGRTYGTTVPVHALRDADFLVRSGEFVSITGASGSGKSTLLNLLGLLDRPTSGAYLIGGTDTAALSEAERTWLRATWFGFIFQAFHLLADRNVIENVELGMLYTGIPRATRVERAREAIERVRLGHRAGAMPTTLSGGERQRVAIARALAAHPKVLLCDEPTGNLDHDTSMSVLDLLDELHTGGLTVLVVTHDREIAGRADRSISVADGVVSP